MGRPVTEPLSEAQREALEHLARCVDDQTYLAGGVAVALRFRHRQSHDIDLFTPSTDPAAQLERLANETQVRVVGQSPGTLQLEANGVPASWIRYRYPLLSPVERLTGIPIAVASLVDLTCMKLAAIADRGAVRDFWDLHEILERGQTSLAEALEAFTRKYPSYDVGHVLKSLVYFADADAEPLPSGLTGEQWEQIKRDLTSCVARE